MPSTVIMRGDDIMTTVQHLERGRTALDVYVGHATGMTLLVREIGAQHMGLKQAIRTRMANKRDMTREELKERLHFLEGLIGAWIVATGRFPHARRRPDDSTDVTVARDLHISLPRLREAVAES
jgi:hypothetical protein